MNNVIPIVFCFDKRIVLGASVAIKSLIDSAKPSTNYDIRIFHSDLDIEIQKNLNKLTENTNHTIAFHYINPDIFKNAPRNNHSWTELVYYRLLTPVILKEYDKAIYSDVDVLFKGDLSELYNTDVSDYQLAAVAAEKNALSAIGHNYFEENKNDYIFWSGLILFNCEKYRNEKLTDKLIQNAKVFYDRLKAYDLDLLNVTCDNILALDLKYCVLQSLIYQNDYKNTKEYKFLKTIYDDNKIEEVIKNPVIIHYAGRPGKPWRMKKPYNDYKEYMDKLPRELKKQTFRDFRKKLFSKV